MVAVNLLHAATIVWSNISNCLCMVLPVTATATVVIYQSVNTFLSEYLRFNPYISGLHNGNLDGPRHRPKVVTGRGVDDSIPL
eukprot:jgi/Chrzof1/12499/Cz06g36150.t1